VFESTQNRPSRNLKSMYSFLSSKQESSSKDGGILVHLCFGSNNAAFTNTQMVRIKNHGIEIFLFTSSKIDLIFFFCE